MTNLEISSFVTGLKAMVIAECNVKGVSPDQIADEDPIIGGSGPLTLDSLDAVEIVAALERNFALKLEDAGSARGVVKSFATMSEFVRRNADPERIAAFIQK